jgi:hypothetical protein
LYECNCCNIFLSVNVSEGMGDGVITSVFIAYCVK